MPATPAHPAGSPCPLPRAAQIMLVEKWRMDSPIRITNTTCCCRRICLENKRIHLVLKTAAPHPHLFRVELVEGRTSSIYCSWGAVGVIFVARTMAINPNRLGYGPPVTMVIYPLPTGTAPPK